jgi:hypothetical protein
LLGCFDLSPVFGHLGDMELMVKPAYNRPVYFFPKRVCKPARADISVPVRESATMMKAKKGLTPTAIKVLLSTLLIGVLIFAIAAPALATESVQHFYLDSKLHAVEGSIATKTLGVATGNVVIPAGEAKFWLANDKAQDNVTFASDVWVILLKADNLFRELDPEAEALNNPSNRTITVGEWDVSNAQFVPFSTTPSIQDYAVDNSSEPNHVDITWSELQAGSGTVHNGNYLALRLKNSDTIDHTIYTDGGSSFKFISDPGYPLPEIAAIVLMGAGVVVLLGYIGLKRLKANPKT